MLKAAIRSVLPPPAVRYVQRWMADQALPGRAKRAAIYDRKAAFDIDPGNAVAVDAILNWLCRAQDCSRSNDGGVARHFGLVSGWGESYPETTGYIIPTLITCGTEDDRPALLERSRRMLDWCVAIQLADGSFQGGTISQTPKVSTTFNTGQILLGLAAGARTFGDPAYVGAMHRAARWLRDHQDEDGCWRAFPTPFARPGDKAYETHVSWGLFEAERVATGHGYGEAGLRQVRWALTHQRENGWFEDCCLSDPARPLTHTIGYALRGLIEAHRLSGDSEFLDRALLTARGVASAVEPDGRLAGRLDADWCPAADWVCMTGSVQLSCCLMVLSDDGDAPELFEPAKALNAYVRKRVLLRGDPDLVGGVRGSFPISGDYGRFEYLNWAAKFAIDAFRAEAVRLSRVADGHQSPR